jgi:hypothetical protein
MPPVRAAFQQIQLAQLTLALRLMEPDEMGYDDAQSLRWSYGAFRSRFHRQSIVSNTLFFMAVPVFVTSGTITSEARAIIGISRVSKPYTYSVPWSN